MNARRSAERLGPPEPGAPSPSRPHQERILWTGRYGSMRIEVIDGQVLVNGQPVEPAPAPGPGPGTASD